jgi:Tol biopolymer transport system component
LRLTPGTRLGVYEVTAQLGAGGMGEVYRATDSNLKRSVAIKVLPASVASDANRLARFQREAEVLAALNHPNIGAIYGLEKTPDFTALVMELVEGEDLSQRIARGAIPIDEALRIARQIADALEAAHEQGIIHRDLKPANIKVREDGTVKVLDFGLAKAIDPAAASSANATSSTLSMQATQSGLILGTAPYMSPEQARGRPVDKRADIWAFGVVLYEMVTGRRPFRGDDVGDVLAAVIKDEPSWDSVPVQLRRLLRRCLEKDPKKRLRDISSVALLLEETPAHVPRARPLPWIAAGALAAVAAVALWAPWRGTRPAVRALVRLDVDLGTDVSLGSPNGTDVIISPDGGRLLWKSHGYLFTRRLDQPRAIQLAGTEGAIAPFFSPDGRWAAFFAFGKLKKVSVEGGASVVLCDAPEGRGGTWSEDGRIILSIDDVFFVLSAAGGKPAPLTDSTHGDVQQRWPQMLPGGQAVLFTVRTLNQSYDDASIDVLTIPDGRRKTIQRGGTFGRYVAGTNGDGYLVYVSRGTMFAVPFDMSRLEVRGEPSPVLDDMAYSSLDGSAQFDVSRLGTMVFRSRAGAGLVTLQWLDATGKTQPLPTKPGVYTQPRLSPDGKLLALSIAEGGGQDIWVYDWQRDAMMRLTSGGEAYAFPVWTSDGRYVVFTSATGVMFSARADGASKPQPLIPSKSGQFPWSVSPDGKRLAFAESGQGGADIWTVPVEADAGGLKAGKAEVLFQSPASEVFPAFSPDGRWIAYRTFESGTSEIEVRSFPDKGGKWLISTSGGAVPVWSPNGRELFYRTEDQRIMVVTYSATGDVFVAEKPRLWTEKRLAVNNARNLDIAPDGTRFVALMPAGAPDEQKTQSHVIFLQNFSDEVRRRVIGEGR